MLATGEVVPVAPARGDFNLDHIVDGLDIAAMLSVLTDLDAYAAAKNLSPTDLLSIGDLNHDNRVSNADIQPLLDALIGGIQPVPEPASLMLISIGGIISCITLRFRRSSSNAFCRQ